MSIPYLNRELSWVEFNQRVLNEALREDLPLLEKVKFLAITASNLDEFFQVRVGGLMLMRRSGRKTPDTSGMTPTKALSALRHRLLKMTADQYQLLQNQIVPALEKCGIRPLRASQLNIEQQAQLGATFSDLIFPLLTPLAVDLENPPLVPAMQIIIACRLSSKSASEPRYVLIPLPDTLGRMVAVSNDSNGHHFILIEDLVTIHAGQLFPEESIDATTVFRVTRNGDIVVEDDDSIDLANEMEGMLTARKFSDTVRLEIRADSPRELAQIVKLVTQATPQEVYRVQGPPGLSHFMELASLAGYEHLRDGDWPAQNSPSIPPGASMLDTLAEHDVLLFHPYESFEPVLRLLEEAAVDPDVVAIKQVLYRTARKSRIIDALILAAANGKNVTALVELKARFDEARNLNRADELQRAGAQIVYGVKGLKTHAKICLIIRRESGHFRRYVHLGTGNYNESTAKLYTDISYLTSKPEYGHDASIFFNAVTGRSKLLRFMRLVPAPNAMKRELLDRIAGETERAKQDLPASIIGKVNSLEDSDIIHALYLASQAGVKIRLNVRGICCLKPGDPKFSKNIQVISVIDRYLEHARIFYFHQGGAGAVYISSADWMNRNLEKRVELMIPIEEPALKRRLIKILEAYFQDNSQASSMLPDGSYARLARAKGQKLYRVQQHFFQMAKKAAKAREHELAMTFEPHIPAE
ncbi:MAG: polyphosphate kinase 1 [Verrucomicrobia bacterium]|nr:MAG: polyphosphate kinase 1 [Verrucomicrobiota bacterium]